MGWGYYKLSDGREAGYMVDAECDFPDCHAQINRGLGWLCGSMPESSEDDGCGFYFCGEHGYPHHDCAYARCDECGKVRDIVERGVCQGCFGEVYV